MVDSNDKLKLNSSTDFHEDYNGSIWTNIGIGLMRDRSNQDWINER